MLRPYVRPYVKLSTWSRALTAIPKGTLALGTPGVVLHQTYYIYNPHLISSNKLSIYLSIIPVEVELDDVTVFYFQKLKFVKCGFLIVLIYFRSRQYCHCSIK